ncbi:hypothetical protein QBC41DRAFT_368204 [Cercophora samala]|uniref:VWFA domain-containing protein n=1 Tax=Cercophora samala TaxID=330535 RepID=A0AA40D5Z5_9PEZI|nr:hypothetical protein QBC41DRAFT_368204 [Cercophora samala]
MQEEGRWGEVREALAAITPICTKYDSNGVDLYFLNARTPEGDPKYYRSIRRSKQIMEIFDKEARPDGWTYTGTRIREILGPYVSNFENAVQSSRRADNTGIKPVNLIVITDGAPSDDPESVIRELARRLDRVDALPHQVGIQFFQVGTDKEAGEALREMDDGLKDVRDMVDTVSFNTLDKRGVKKLTADGLLKVVLGSVNRRLDRIRLEELPPGPQPQSPGGQSSSRYRSR